ncbi:MAG: 2,3,4,5-tetrahydropyridine-2,6-dicarboxylate N-succinyltransferase [Deltaproteobacteria bacterium]|jgi:2,3,4,5-tetrahydropyridine-2-carboxylate N-succinyltransferase|nr:2,3,4,5-tetrahydropyridine-2,6-dicarboxylate N-succinyltransferase [Deltaproteobacteria bacterium]MBW2535533.1 2,3,4,5-tetrahydropyridine-2,6-dicarboxylate N-succinyltransferase [Deltaproteobacteria bacterium]
MTERSELRELVNAAYADRQLLESVPHQRAVEQVLERLDRGQLRAASRGEDGAWQSHPWIARAILLYFQLRRMEVHEIGPYTFHDKIPLKRGLDEARVRVVPPGTVRYGAYLEPGVVLMPGYVNIGAYVGARTMVDTWATVGSCAQVGQDCHIAGGAGLGGVLEPPGARPVIIEDGAFVGSRAVVVEGALVEREAVIGANVVLTASTRVVDVTGAEPVEYRGRVPARSVVIPGTRPKRFPAGEYGVPCALIIGKRSESTDRKVSLEQALRDHEVSV